MKPKKTGYYDRNGNEISMGDRLAFYHDTYNKSLYVVGTLTDAWKVNWDSPEWNQNFFAYTKGGNVAKYLEVCKD